VPHGHRQEGRLGVRGRRLTGTPATTRHEQRQQRQQDLQPVPGREAYERGEHSHGQSVPALLIYWGALVWRPVRVVCYRNDNGTSFQARSSWAMAVRGL